MLRLNRDVLYLIFEELQNDRKTFYSCLSVNKTWSEIIIPILWKNPWKYLKRGKEKLLLNVIISHLSDELRDSLSPDTNPSTYLYQRPSFNYISLCRHLNLSKIKMMINIVYVESKISIINKIFNLFINKNTKFTHLYIPSQFNYQIHLIPGAKHCLSELEFLYCNTSIKDSALDGLLEMCKSVRVLELYINQKNINHGIVKLIEAPRKLYDVRFVTWGNEPFCEILENSLIERANTIQYFKITNQPATKILSSFKNLKRLELKKLEEDIFNTWNCLENLSLPLLQILKAENVPIKALISLIENTSGSLTEINISHMRNEEINDIDNKRMIQAIYQKCPNLNYLKILFKNSNILELENLLINCKYLNGLVIVTVRFVEHDWDNLFNILSKSPPTGLFKFKIFSTGLSDKLKSLELFFDNWRGRHPMLLQIIPGCSHILTNYFFDLIEKYKTEGIVEKFDFDLFGWEFEDFEWFQKKFFNF